MTKEENIQRVKNETLNKIKHLYNPQTKHDFTYYDGEGSLMEQISFEVKRLIEGMDKEIKKIK
jgi:hypothetical protein